MAVCAVTYVVLVQFYGNSTFGYIKSASLFWWWISQWLDAGAAEQHHDQVAIERAALARRRHIVEDGIAVPGAQFPCGRASPQQHEQLPDLPVANLGGISGKAGVDVKNFDRRIAAQSLHQGRDHRALPVQRRRGLGKHEELHPEVGLGGGADRCSHRVCLPPPQAGSRDCAS